jgi:hypothetical protein
VDDDKAFADVVLYCQIGDKDLVLSYFEGKLNGKDLCYFDGIDYHRFREGMFTSFLKSSPNFLVNGTDPDAKLVKQLWLGCDYLNINEPKEHGLQFVSSITKDTTVQLYVEKYFIPGKTVRILDRQNSGGAPYDKVEGMMINLFAKGNTTFGQISTTYGTQSPQSYFKVLSVKEGVIFGNHYYDLVFDIRCDLFKYRVKEHPDALFGVLEGQYHTRLFRD